MKHESLWVRFWLTQRGYSVCSKGEILYVTKGVFFMQQREFLYVAKRGILYEARPTASAWGVYTWNMSHCTESGYGWRKGGRGLGLFIAAKCVKSQNHPHLSSLYYETWVTAWVRLRLTQRGSRLDSTVTVRGSPVKVRVRVYEKKDDKVKWVATCNDSTVHLVLLSPTIVNPPKLQNLNNQLQFPPGRHGFYLASVLST